MQEHNNDSMPAYFAFLTLMAYNIFLKEQTDVAIIEVGIGGQYDSTNLVRKPAVCGVTSLGMDHVSILGNTIEKIAWQKAGIFKPGVPAFTSPQCSEALKVLHERAEEKGCHLEVAPHFSSYERPGEKFKLGIAGHMQKVNASLALQLTRTWMKSQGVLKGEVLNGVNEASVNGHDDLGVAKPFPFNQSLINGLVECKWLGRNQTIKKNKLTYYLDGAHTLESIQQLLSSHPPLAEGNVWKALRRVLRPTCGGCAGICEIKVPGRCQCVVDRVCIRNPNRVGYVGSRG
ncbi:folylpolyglutamate synthase [Mytilus galloprovincialis]|nr:folylpolyglutamate synthase [Mytilus galloprovincialis]